MIIRTGRGSGIRTGSARDVEIFYSSLGLDHVVQNLDQLFFRHLLPRTVRPNDTCGALLEHFSSLCAGFLPGLSYHVHSAPRSAYKSTHSGLEFTFTFAETLCLAGLQPPFFPCALHFGGHRTCSAAPCAFRTIEELSPQLRLRREQLSCSTPWAFRKRVSNVQGFNENKHSPKSF